ISTPRRLGSQSTSSLTGVAIVPSFQVPIGPARQRLRDALAWVEDFVTECQRLATEQGPLPWPAADSLELVGLERWGRQLAKADRLAGVCALVLAAQHGFPTVVTRGGAALAEVGMRGKEGDPFVSGASVEVQLGRAARWVDEPIAANAALVRDAFDPTRQLNLWEDDLRPDEAQAFYWYLEVGQCACAAIFREDGDPDAGAYDGWPPEVSVGRGLVIAARGLRSESTTTSDVLQRIYAALVA
ncbi:MAG: hypothetical protein M3680_08685, partial [Myxococcota bacterium]|nr:hypothetical protein [Myxococcota bacterium]